MEIYPEGVTVRQVNKGNRRWYEVDGDERVEGRELRNVSSVVQVVDKPGLRFWMQDQAYRQMHKAMQDPMNSLLDVEQVIPVAKNNLTDGDKKAASGTAFHELYSEVFHAIMRGESPEVPLELVAGIDAVDNYLSSEGLTPELSEVPVYHPLWSYGGTIDLIVSNSEGKLEVIDLKTGKCYDEYALQVAAYMTALQTMSGLEVVGGRVLCVDTERGTVEPKVLNRPDRHHFVFINALELDRWIRDKDKWA